MLVYLACLAGCSLLRPQWMELVEESGLESRWIQTSKFRHRVFVNLQPGSHLRIYVEGDGSPWLHRNRIATDPTPANPVLLRLMHRADHAAAYLGRPCYFGSATDPNCSSRWWTFDRYGKTVIESMCDAANALIDELQAKTVQLIGYSGGGALVVGMTTCTNHVIAITTIAGNLVPSDWVKHHGYTELRDLTLVEAVPQGVSHVAEIHWQCKTDEVIPVDTTAEYFLARPSADRRIIKHCSHSTGWERVWPELVVLEMSE